VDPTHPPLGREGNMVIQFFNLYEVVSAG